MDYLTLDLAVGATERHVLSARPDAPVRDEPPRRARFARPRQLTAGVLRRIANRIEPARATRPAQIGPTRATTTCSA